MRCARLTAPFVTALCMFDLAPRRLCRSSLLHHGFEPCEFLPDAATGFSPWYQTFFYSTYHSQHSPFRRINIAILVCDFGTALRRMSIRFFRRRGSHDLNPASLRMLAMMMRITYRTRGLRLGATPCPAKVMWQGRGGFSRPVERRKKRRMRPDFDASAFRPET